MTAVDRSNPGEDRSLSRRTVLAAAPLATAALVGPHWFGRPAAAQGAGIGAEMVTRASAWLALLDETQRDAASFSFDGRTRRDWNYMLGSRTAPGLPLERMTADQRTAALDLLATGLSPDGLAKAERVMVLQDVLREMGRGSADRNGQRFSTAVFGTPSPTDPWGWRFEGHHLTLSFTLVGDRVVSVTPSSFSADPNEVADGRHRGLVALVEEERLGRRLFRDLAPTTAGRAVIAEQAFGNVLTLAGREDRVAGARQGVPLADLAAAQRDLAMRIVDLYAVDHLAAPLADEQRARVRDGDVMATHFGWAGSDRPGEMVYYRLHGDSFVIEFASLRNQPLHLHTIRHDVERNLGRHAVG